MKTTLFAVLAFAMVAPVTLANVFTFTYSDPNGVFADGTLIGDLGAPGTYNIVSGTINLSDLANSGIDGVGILAPIPLNGVFETGGGTNISGLAGSDTNLYYPGQNPMIDGNGVFLFNLISGPGAGSGVLIGALGPSNYQMFAGNWAVNDLGGGGTFTATDTGAPEPGSLLLLVSGIGLCLGVGLWKKTKAARAT